MWVWSAWLHAASLQFRAWGRALRGGGEGRKEDGRKNWQKGEGTKEGKGKKRKRDRGNVRGKEKKREKKSVREEGGKEGRDGEGGNTSVSIAQQNTRREQTHSQQSEVDQSSKCSAGHRDIVTRHIPVDKVCYLL